MILLKDTNNIDDSTISCGLCKKHSSALHIREKDWDNIVRNGMKMDKKWTADYKMYLNRHERGDQHTRVVEYLKKKAKNEILDDPIGTYLDTYFTKITYCTFYNGY